MTRYKRVAAVTALALAACAAAPLLGSSVVAAASSGFRRGRRTTPKYCTTRVWRTSASIAASCQNSRSDGLGFKDVRGSESNCQHDSREM